MSFLYCCLSAEKQANSCIKKMPCGFFEDGSPFDVAYEAGMEVIMSDTTAGYYEPVFSVPDVLKDPQEMLIKLFMVLHRAPLLKYLGSTAVFTYLLFMAIAIFWARRIKWFLPLLPALISFVFVILGPAIYAHPRYMFPVVYSLPFVIVYGVMAVHRQPDSSMKN